MSTTIKKDYREGKNGPKIGRSELQWWESGLHRETGASDDAYHGDRNERSDQDDDCGLEDE